MKYPRQFAAIASLLVLLASPNVSAVGEPITDAQIEVIRQNCVAAQSSMQRLELNEAVTRRNRGVSYESTLKLMATLNSRIAFNKLNAPTLTSLTAEINKKRTEFAENYISYNNSFTITMKLPNCQEQPVTFYDYLTQTRQLRAKLSTGIDDIDRLLDSYQTALNELKQSTTTTAQPQAETAQ